MNTQTQVIEIDGIAFEFTKEFIVARKNDRYCYLVGNIEDEWYPESDKTNKYEKNNGFKIMQPKMRGQVCQLWAKFFLENKTTLPKFMRQATMKVLFAELASENSADL